MRAEAHVEDLLAVYTTFCAAAPAQNFMVGHSFGCAACNMQRKFKMHQHATCNVQQAACNIRQPLTCSLQQSLTCNMQHMAVTDMQHATYASH